MMGLAEEARERFLLEIVFGEPPGFGVLKMVAPMRFIEVHHKATMELLRLYEHKAMEGLTDGGKA